MAIILDYPRRRRRRHFERDGHGTHIFFVLHA